MRLVLFNAHKELWFGKSVKVWLYKMPWKPKYAFILREHIRRSGQIHILLPEHVGKFRLVHYFFEWLHVKLWAAVNGHNPLSVKTVLNPKQMRDSDVLLVMYVGNFVLHDGPKNVDRLVPYLNDCHGRIVLNVNHYPYHAGHASTLLRGFRFDAFWAENDLRTNSSFFREHFSDFPQRFIVTPFAVRANFNSLKAYAQRKKAAIAVGSVSLKMTDDQYFVAHFKHDNLQPLRDAIYHGIPEAYREKLHTVVSHINQGGAARPVRGAPNPITAIRNWFHNVFIGGQRKYHSFDMCALFNDYKVHIVGEEVVGLPGIGFAEGMMCGTAFMGLDDAMYRVHGLIPDVHYITYTGGYEEMLLKLDQVINDDDRLASISRAGHEFAKTNFTESSVYKKLMLQLTEQAVGNGARS